MNRLNLNSILFKPVLIFDIKINHLKNQLLSSHLKLHFIVLIYGFTAILGKLITLPAIQIVWYRMMIAFISFFFFLLWKRTELRVNWARLLKLLGIGSIVALHWLAFFGAIKIANVSVALGCLATSTLFTSLLEPFFMKKRIDRLEVIIGLLIIGGLYLIFRYETSYSLGILVALAAAFLAGLYSVLNKKMVVHLRGSVISFYEMMGGLICLTLYMLINGDKNIALPNPTDLIYLLILGIICTAYAFAVQINIMKHLSAYIVALTINLEPVYGILLAFYIFGETEHMTAGFYLGTTLILVSVLGFPLYHYYRRLKDRNEALAH